MKRRSLIIVALVLAISASLFLSGRALAGTYLKYVFSSPDGGKVFVFSKPGSPWLEYLLSQIFGLRGPKTSEPSPFEPKEPGTGLKDPAPGTGTGGLAPAPSPNPSPVPVPQPKPIPQPQPVPTEPAPQPQPQPVPAPSPEPAPKPQPAPGSEPKPEPQPNPEANPSQGLTAEEKAMFELVNKERVKTGLEPLKIDMRLTELARKKSQDMIDKNYFSHTSPTYGSPFDMMKKAGITYMIAGENLAGASTVKRAHEALMNSEGHRRNILNPSFTHIGIGVAKGGPYGMMFTQMFIGN